MLMELAAGMRQVIVTVLRIAGVVLLVLAAYSFISLVEGAAILIGMDPGYRWNHFVTGGRLTDGLRFVIHAGLGWFLCAYSGRLAVWLVPRVGAVCLRCGYRLEAANGGVCPECGRE